MRGGRSYSRYHRIVECHRLFPRCCIKTSQYATKLIFIQTTHTCPPPQAAGAVLGSLTGKFASIPFPGGLLAATTVNRTDQDSCTLKIDRKHEFVMND